MCEIPFLPLKGLYVGGVSFCCGIFKRAGFDEDWTGFINGAKLAAQNWAKARDEIEDKILGRETASEKKMRVEKELQKRKKL